MTVAQNILAQLGSNRFRVMTGAKDFVNTGNGLSFRVGRNAKGVTHVRIELTPADLYAVSFLKYSARTFTSTVVAEADGVYADQLQRVFTEHTGLDTHL